MNKLHKIFESYIGCITESNTDIESIKKINNQKSLFVLKNGDEYIYNIDIKIWTKDGKYVRLNDVPKNLRDASVELFIKQDIKKYDNTPQGDYLKRIDQTPNAWLNTRL